MPTGGHPEASRQNETWPVQLERCHGGTACRSRSIDPRRTLGPCEVLHPFLQTRIEDSHVASGLRIDDEKPIAFMVVAERTGKPEIALGRWPAEGTWDQMVEFHRSSNDNFLGQTVATSVARLLGDEPAQLDRDVLRAHRGARSVETSCPRSLRSLAACARISIVCSYSWRSLARAASSSRLNPSSRCLRCRASSSWLACLGIAFRASRQSSSSSKPSSASTASRSSGESSAAAGAADATASRSSVSRLRRLHSARCRKRS